MSPRRGGMFTSLSIHNYRLFLGGSLISNTGTWMQRIAQDWLVLGLSGNSGVALGVVTALQFGPILLFGMYGGVLADRYDKRKILLGTQAAMGLLALVLGLLDATGNVALWHVYLLAAGLGVATSIDTPVRQAFVSELVGSEHLPNAVGLNSSAFNTARLIGPAVAGLLIAGWGTAPVFLINAGSFVWTLWALSAMRVEELRPSVRQTRAPGQLLAGLQYVRQRPDLMLAMFLVFIVGTFGMNFQLTTALMSKEVFGLGAGAFGLLGSCIAVGSLTGSLLATRRRERPRLRLLVVAAFGFGLLEFVVAFMPTYASFAVLLVPTGAAALTFMTAANSSVQLGTDPTMRGRVMALYLLFFMGGTPVGAPIVGWLAEQFGARYGIAVGGLASMAAAVGVALYLAARSGMRVDAGFRGGPHLTLLEPGREAVRTAR